MCQLTASYTPIEPVDQRQSLAHETTGYEAADQFSAQGGRTGFSNPIDLAELIRGMQAKGMTRREIEDHLHLSKAHVNNLLRLLSLPPDIRDAIRTGQLALAKGRTLAGLQELDLPETELHELMREFMAKTSHDETCAEFNQHIQDFKAQRMGRSRVHSQQKRVADMNRLEARVKKLVSVLKSASDDTETLAELVEILRPLQVVVAQMLERAMPTCEVTNDAQLD